MLTDTLAIDFGTSNSAAAICGPDGPIRIPIERDAETLPTAVFFPTDGAKMLIGNSAGEALIAGEDGRYMRALKSVLGTPLLHEPRLVGGRRQTLAEIVTHYLAAVRTCAEARTGHTFTRALSGRPVHFHSADPDKDAQAEIDLRGCYLAAGFEEVSFLPEPQAAAIACQDMSSENALGLIVDIGGGTSDFTVFRRNGRHLDILANHGIRLGGTNFDQIVSMSRAMPELGLGGELKREMGKGLLPVPKGLYVDLSTWAKIPFTYAPETRRLVANMERLAVEPNKMARLATLLEMELGHDLAFAVETAKIGANGADELGQIEMGFLEKGLTVPVSCEDLQQALGRYQADLGQAALHTIKMAGIKPCDISTSIMVGGSSLMRFVTDEISQVCSEAKILRAQAFTAVVDGLALATRN